MGASAGGGGGAHSRRESVLLAGGSSVGGEGTGCHPCYREGRRKASLIPNPSVATFGVFRMSSPFITSSPSSLAGLWPKPPPAWG